MPYLVCDSCKGYYELQEGESIQDFLRCSCGGNLTYIEKLQDMENSGENGFHDNSEDLGINETARASFSRFSGPGGVGFYLLILLFFIIAISAAASFEKIFLVSNNTTNKSTLLGSNSQGYVDKYIYGGNSSTNANNKKIAIVTGIHPREKLSKSVWTDLLRNYTVPPGWTVVQYDINVVEDPEDFSKGRSNGEALAFNYILPDVRRSGYDLIIVCHDHEPGYGEGFFFATPRMDSKSVGFAELLHQKLSNFNYYKNNNNSEEGSSNIHFTNYLVADGYRTIVYEMPGLSSYDDAYNMTKMLLINSLQIL